MESEKVPHHLAVIPDGNRRWSRKQGISLAAGYKHGVDNFRKIMTASFRKGVKYFTIWGASEDNLLKRSKLEVDILTRLLKEELKDILKSEEIEREKVRVTIKGKGIDMLKDAELTTLANEVEEKTRSHQNHHFTLLFGYDGKSEMLHAIEEIQKRPSEKVNYESVKKNLMTGELPAVDLVIRTGGEPHWSSGFLMWLTADSELHFTETFWPAFGERQLAHAFQDFAGRRSLKGK